MTAQAIDDVLAGTFPASDPPAWTSGIARTAPETPARRADRAPARAAANAIRADLLDVSRPPGSGRTFAHALVSLIGAAGLAMLVPVAMLVIGTPVALAARGVVELAERLLAMVR